MYRQLLICIVVAVMLAPPAIVSADKGEAVVTPLTTTVPVNVRPMNIGNSSSATTTCQVGNLDGATTAISNFILPPEDYALIFDADQCANCPLGLEITDVHIFVQVSAATTIVMGTLVADVSLANPACPAPGTNVLCSAGLFNVNLPSAGLYDISLPVTCTCLNKGQLYTLDIYIDSVTGPTPDLVTDSSPTNCTNWNNFGTGWFDLVVDNGFPGDLILFADATCCDASVPTEEKTWGEIKDMYKD